jgi:hypothetical protein
MRRRVETGFIASLESRDGARQPTNTVGDYLDDHAPGINESMETRWAAHTHGGCMDSRTLRGKFVAGLIAGLRVVWPILSALLVLICALGLLTGLIEGWSVQESIYFAFVSGLTIGYGDLAPKLLLTRTLAILIGVCGVLLTALVAAVAVKALTAASVDSEE